VLDRENIEKITSRTVFLFLCIFALVLPVSISASQIALGTTVLFWLILVLVRRKNPIHSSPILWSFVIFAVWGLVSAVFSADPGYSAFRWCKNLWFASIFLVVTDTVKNERKARILLTLTIATAGIAGLYGVFQRVAQLDFFRHTTYISDWGTRASGFFGSPLSFGYQQMQMLILSFVLAIYAAKSKMKRPVIWYCLATICLAVGLALSGSRGAWSGLIVGVFTLGFCVSRRLGVRIVTAIIAAVVIIGVIAPNSYVVYRARTLLKFRQDNSSYQRLLIWKATLDMAKDYPVTGVGWGAYGKVYPEYCIPEESIYMRTTAHNNYLNSLAETGWPGLATLMFFLCTPLIIGLRKTLGTSSISVRLICIGISSAIVALMIAGITQTWLFDAEVAMMFYFLIGVMDACRRMPT